MIRKANTFYQNQPASVWRIPIFNYQQLINIEAIFDYEGVPISPEWFPNTEEDGFYKIDFGFNTYSGMVVYEWLEPEKIVTDSGKRSDSIAFSNEINLKIGGLSDNCSFVKYKITDASGNIEIGRVDVAKKLNGELFFTVNRNFEDNYLPISFGAIVHADGIYLSFKPDIHGEFVAVYEYTNL